MCKLCLACWWAVEVSCVIGGVLVRSLYCMSVSAFLFWKKMSCKMTLPGFLHPDVTGIFRLWRKFHTGRRLHFRPSWLDNMSSNEWVRDNSIIHKDTAINLNEDGPVPSVLVNVTSVWCYPQFRFFFRRPPFHPIPIRWYHQIKNVSCVGQFVAEWKVTKPPAPPPPVLLDGKISPNRRVLSHLSDWQYLFRFTLHL